jgi:hypothetical protein
VSKTAANPAIKLLRFIVISSFALRDLVNC